MTTEWLVTNIRAVGFPDEAECAIQEVILVGRFLYQLPLHPAHLCQNVAIYVPKMQKNVIYHGEPHCDEGAPLEL